MVEYTQGLLLSEFPDQAPYIHDFGGVGYGSDSYLQSQLLADSPDVIQSLSDGTIDHGLHFFFREILLPL